MKEKLIYLVIAIFLMLLMPLTSDSNAQNFNNSTIITFTDGGQNLGVGASFTIALGDIDSDGDSDAVFTNYFGANKVWTNNGNGQFFDSGQSLGSTSGGHGAALGDLDGDDDLDLFLVFTNSFDKVFLNDGKGIFTDSGQNLGNSDDIGLNVLLGDIDNDSDLDALVACYQHQNKIWINDGNGNYSDSNQNLGGIETVFMALGDVDSDGDLDVYVASVGNDIGYGSYNKIYFNETNVTGIEQQRLIPHTIILNQNYPNPFNPVTTIRYYLPKDIKVNLTIYDTIGQELKTLVNNFQSSGNKSVVWDGTDNAGNEVSSGVYIYELKAGEISLSKKMLLIR